MGASAVGPVVRPRRTQPIVRSFYKRGVPLLAIHIDQPLTQYQTAMIAKQEYVVALSIPVCGRSLLTLNTKDAIRGRVSKTPNHSDRTILATLGLTLARQLSSILHPRQF